MVFKTKYSVGDVIKFNKKKLRAVVEKCEYCDGTGEVVAANGKKIECSMCGGNGEHIGSESYLCSAEDVITEVRVGFTLGRHLEGYCQYKFLRCKQWVDEDDILDAEMIKWATGDVVSSMDLGKRISGQLYEDE